MQSTERLAFNINVLLIYISTCNLLMANLDIQQ